MAICCCSSLGLHHWLPGVTARKSTYLEKFWELFKTVQTPWGHPYPPTPPQRRPSGSKNKVFWSCGRNVMFFIGFVTMHKTLGHATVSNCVQPSKIQRGDPYAECTDRQSRQTPLKNARNRQENMFPECSKPIWPALSSFFDEFLIFLWKLSFSKDFLWFPWVL